ncbi:MAG: DUF2141 domain-containing protein [Sphingomonas bacterium]|nr:DUF2141 domain-containing protein [Sphingomonas bacterium]
MPAPAPAQASATTTISVEIVGLRDARGVVHLCLTREPQGFPACKGPGSLHVTIHASVAPLHYQFRSVPAGTYAVSAIHDSNNDGKLNTSFGMPTEGFAFSRNPKMRMRAPRFNEASFETNSRSLEPLKMKYLL